MRIELFEQSVGPDGDEAPEVWMKVATNEVIDVPTVLGRHLSVDQREIMRGYKTKPCFYWSPRLDGDYDLEHDFLFEDWFVFKVRGSVAK